MWQGTRHKIMEPKKHECGGDSAMKEKAVYVKQLELGPMQNFVYLVGDPITKECVVIDPAWDVPKILETAKKDGMKISSILISHGHPDHINGVEPLLQQTDCTVHLQKREADFLPWKWKNLVKTESGDTITVGNISIKVIHTPGHTPGSQCFLVENRLFSGDTLFINGCGRVDFPGGNPEEMYLSLTKLKSLDGQTILFPGHNYAEQPTSTIEDEKRHNPYLQFPSAQAFMQMMGGGTSSLFRI